jgi:hypothetical protein
LAGDQRKPGRQIEIARAIGHRGVSAVSRHPRPSLATPAFARSHLRPSDTIPPARLCITDEASPFALRSTRNRPRRAVRRGAAWPPERQSSWPHRRACMGCRAPKAPSTGTRFGVRARGRSAWWPRRSGCRPCRRYPVRTLSASLASIRASVQCPRMPVHATGRCRPRPGDGLVEPAGPGEQILVAGGKWWGR